MPIHNPPQYRYSLFESWDKEAFELIKSIGQNKNYPQLFGSDQDKNDLLIALIRSQKSQNDYRDFLKVILSQVKLNGTIDTKSLVVKNPPKSIINEKPAWVTYREDEIVNNFIDELSTRKLRFIGTYKEMSEFVIRFILGQLGNDWEATIMMIWEMLGDQEVIAVKQLNEEMRNFDYMKIFE